MLERTRGAEGIDADKVEHEDRCALQVDNENLARESGDKEEERTQKENLEDDDGEERLQVPGKMVRADTGVVCPGAKVPRNSPKIRPEKAKTVATKEPAQRPPR